jgi:hypothetical protein
MQKVIFCSHAHPTNQTPTFIFSYVRIVAFIGSPVEADEKELMKIAKKLKKEKVSIDIVSFGEDQVRCYKLVTHS